jgi:hypothetical protein
MRGQQRWREEDSKAEGEARGGGTQKLNIMSHGLRTMGYCGRGEESDGQYGDQALLIRGGQTTHENVAAGLNRARQDGRHLGDAVARRDEGRRHDDDADQVGERVDVRRPEALEDGGNLLEEVRN